MGEGPIGSIRVTWCWRGCRLQGPRRRYRRIPRAWVSLLRPGRDSRTQDHQGRGSEQACHLILAFLERQRVSDEVLLLVLAELQAQYQIEELHAVREGQQPAIVEVR